jgi:hypothetical protein
MPRPSLTSCALPPDALSPNAGFGRTLSHLMRVLAGRSLTSGVVTRCAVVVGVLAVIAGIFGMHVMTGSHASHSAAAHSDVSHAVVSHSDVSHAASAHTASLHAAAAHSAAADDGGRQPGGPAHPAGDAVVVLSAGAVCGGACPEAEEAGAECVPSAASGALTVVAPPATAIRQEARGDIPPAAYFHLPPAPTPCELSISRT